MKACPPEQLNIILINESVLLDALDLVSGCSRCDENALVPFDYIFDALTELDPTVTEYLMYKPLKCPICSSKITEKTYVKIS